MLALIEKLKRQPAKYTISFTQVMNAGYQFTSRAITLASSAVITALIGRFWGADQLGLYASLTVVSSYFLVLFDPGLSSLLFRQFSERPNDAARTLAPALGLLSASALPATAVTSLVVSITIGDFPSMLAAALVTSVWLALGSWNSSLVNLHYANEQMGRETQVILMERLLSLGLVAVVVQTTTRIELLLLALVVPRAFAFLLYLAATRRLLGSVRVTFKLPELVVLLRQGVPFWSHSFFTSFHVTQGVLVLTILGTASEVGWYRSANLIYAQIPIAAMIVNISLYPRMMRTWAHHDYPGLITRIRQSCILTSAIGILAAMVTFASAGTIINLLYGENFERAVAPLQILAISFPITFLNNSLGVGLNVIDKQPLRARISATGAVFSAAITLLLVERFSLIGAAWGVLLTEALLLCFLAPALYHSIRDLATIGRSGSTADSHDAPRGLQG